MLPTTDKQLFNFSETMIKLNHPLITLDEKAFFLKKYVSKHTKIHFDGKNNIVKVDIHNPNAVTLSDKLMNRVGDYLKNGTISLGTISLSGYSKKEAMDMLKNLIDRINIQFDMYIRSNHSIRNRVGNNIFNGIQEFNKLYNFDNHINDIVHANGDYQEEDEIIKYLNNKKEILNNNPLDINGTPLNQQINGIHPEWQAHPYQIDFIKICRQNLLWTNAYATGLGKTSTALMVIQDQHNLKLKNRTVFLVPKSTLSNWYKESLVGGNNKSAVYAPSIEDECVFINLLEPSKYKTTKQSILKYNKTEGYKAGNFIVPPEYADDPVYLLVLSLMNKNIDHYDYLSLPVDEQLKLVRDNVDIHNNPKQYKKIFMSHQDFYRLRLKSDTTESYIKYLKLVDSDFAQSEFSESAGYSKRVESLLNILHEESNGKNKCDLFLEDMNVDSLVADEAHIFKNAVNPVKGNYDRVKYFSTPPASAIGTDLLAKTYYIKEKNLSKDGILALTATPLTNSPLEIYSVLSLVIGQYFINKLLSVNSLNDFLTLFCMVENQEDYSVDGDLKNFDIFKGINNLKMLRSVLFKCTYFLHAKDERIKEILKLPEAHEHINSIDMSNYQKNKILSYKSAYNFGKEAKIAYEQGGWVEYNSFISNKAVSDTLDPVMNKFHEHPFTIGSPFNFIRKMERLVLDEDLNEMATFLFIDKKYQKQVEEAVQKFNAKKIKQKDRPRINPHTSESAIFEVKERDMDEDGTSVYQIANKHLYSFYVEAKIIDLDNVTDKTYSDAISYLLNNHNNGVSLNSLTKYKKDFSIDFDNDLMIVLDTLKFKEQELFFDLLAKSLKMDEHELSNILRFNISNKVKTMLSSFIYEFNQPRGKLMDGNNASIVKQLLFCDYLGLHFKLKHLLHQLTGINLSKIEIITGQHNNENEQIQSIQDGFNAEEKDNLYSVIIANEKAQEGINLQIGTQAIHHLTIGWTPDSNIQRNGRGVRQGNKTDFVNVYSYDLKDTFDTYKRNLVNRKSDWIDTIIDANGDDYVLIVEMLSQEQQNRMIELIGNTSEDETKSNLEKYEEQVKQENIQKEIQRVKNLQRIYLEFLNNKDVILESNNKTSVVNNASEAEAELETDMTATLALAPSVQESMSNNIVDKTEFNSTQTKNAEKQFIEYHVDELLNAIKEKMGKSLTISSNYASLSSQIAGQNQSALRFGNISAKIRTKLQNLLQSINRYNQSIYDKNIRQNQLSSFKRLSMMSVEQVNSLLTVCNSPLFKNKHLYEFRLLSEKDKSKININLDNYQPINIEQIDLHSDDAISQINQFLWTNKANFLLYQVPLELDNKSKRDLKTIALSQSYIDNLVFSKLQYMNLDILRLFLNHVNQLHTGVMQKLLEFYQKEQSTDLLINKRNAINENKELILRRMIMAIKEKQSLSLNENELYLSKHILFVDLIILTVLMNMPNRGAVSSLIEQIINSFIRNHLLKNTCISHDDIQSKEENNKSNGSYAKILTLPSYAVNNASIYPISDYDKDSNPLLMEINDLNKLNNDIYHMAVDGYKNLAKQSPYLHYPANILDNLDELYRFNDLIINPNTIVFSIGLRRLDDVVKNIDEKQADNELFVQTYLHQHPDINLLHNEQTIHKVFDELGDILQCKANNSLSSQPTLFTICNMLDKFFKKHKITLTKFGNSYLQTKVYPIDRTIELYSSHYNLESNGFGRINIQNQFAALPLINKANKTFAYSQTMNKYEQVEFHFNRLFRSDNTKYDYSIIKHFEIYPNNHHGYYQLLNEAIALLEYQYINNVNPYISKNYDSFLHQNNVLFENVQSVFEEDHNVFHFDYHWLEAYKDDNSGEKMLSNSIVKKEFDGQFNDVYELSRDKVKLILDYQPIEPEIDYQQFLDLNDEETDNDWDEYNDYPKLHELNNIFAMYGINIPNERFFIIDIKDSYKMYIKYQYRDIADCANESIYFHKNANKGYSFKGEREAYLALKSHQADMKKTAHDKQWVIGRKTLMYLLYDMINDQEEDYKNLDVYRLDGYKLSL